MSNNPIDGDLDDKAKMSRRDFIKFLGATGAALTLPSLVPLGKAFGVSANTTGINNNASSQANMTNSQLKATTSSVYTFNLDEATPQVSTANGSRTTANADNFPILSGMGMLLLRLEKGGVREPHWHPNASELSYCIKGQVRFTVYGPNKEMETSEIGKGQVFFVPAGYFHYLENSDDVNNDTVASFFGNENPEFIGLVGGLSS